uniref:Putative secreted protein n=1 Tax=Anopheles darlingi TaxID=43151 RepID=A0A2M4DKW4_ANODA
MARFLEVDGVGAAVTAAVLAALAPTFGLGFGRMRALKKISGRQSVSMVRSVNCLRRFDFRCSFGSSGSGSGSSLCGALRGATGRAGGGTGIGAASCCSATAVAGVSSSSCLTTTIAVAATVPPFASDCDVGGGGGVVVLPLPSTSVLTMGACVGAPFAPAVVVGVATVPPDDVIAPESQQPLLIVPAPCCTDCSLSLAITAGGGGVVTLRRLRISFVSFESLHSPATTCAT